MKRGNILRLKWGWMTLRVGWLEILNQHIQCGVNGLHPRATRGISALYLNYGVRKNGPHLDCEKKTWGKVNKIIVTWVQGKK